MEIFNFSLDLIIFEKKFRIFRTKSFSHHLISNYNGKIKYKNSIIILFIKKIGK